MSEVFRSGFIGLFGPANAGKSTLLNAVLGEKVAIVSPKAQTTRNRIVGIKNRAGAQLIFVDTPGFLKKSWNGALGKQLRHSLQEAAGDVDVQVLVLDSSLMRRDSEHLEEVRQALEREELRQPDLIALNKCDIGTKDELLPLFAKLNDTFPGVEIIPISGLKRDGLEVLEEVILKRLPEGPQFFPDDISSDQSEEFLVSEIIREKLFRKLQKEVPYSTAVRVERWEEKENAVVLNAVIYVERESQKAIVIGKGGQQIKEIGTAARIELERILETQVYLQLFVRVEENWTHSDRGLAKTGFRFSEGA